MATAEIAAICAALRFLLLTGQRRSEATEMVRGEGDASGLWTIPAIRKEEAADRGLLLTADLRFL